MTTLPPLGTPPFGERTDHLDPTRPGQLLSFLPPQPPPFRLFSAGSHAPVFVAPELLDLWVSLAPTTETNPLPAMDQHDDFDNVSWRNDPESDASRPNTSGTDAEEPRRYEQDTNGKRRMSSAHEEPQAGPLADAVDLAGIGDGVLECRVDSPLKENDGTKDAYISYLVTTHVSAPRPFGPPKTKLCRNYGCLSASDLLNSRDKLKGNIADKH